MKLKSFLFHSIFWMLLLLSCLAILEVGLRAYRSLTYDGALFLKGSSPNYELHEKFGWISRKNFKHLKKSDFYGHGWANYNELGFRARPFDQAEDADFKVCILGDSYMQGHQMPDGKHLPHLLEKALERKYKTPYVLPLAVGGYGSLQEYMLFEDYGIPFSPDVIIQQWCGNDIINNSFEAEKNNFGNNNVLRRPYFENGEVVYRRPYKIHISDWVDNLVIFKVINILLARNDSKQLMPEQERVNQEIGWDVAAHFAKAIAQLNIAPYIVLVSEEEKRAQELFRSNGAIVVTYHVPDKFKNLPVDNHFNGAGHQILLDQLLPVLDTLFTEENF